MHGHSPRVAANSSGFNELILQEVILTSSSPFKPNAVDVPDSIRPNAVDVPDSIRPNAVDVPDSIQPNAVDVPDTEPETPAAAAKK